MSPTPYNHTQYPTAIITMVVFFYYRYKLSLVDITEIMALRNVYLSHETVRRWVQIFGADLANKCRKTRAKGGVKWHMDITYCTIKGHWYYLYRAIDKVGNLVDVYLSETRDKKAALRFFKQCHQATGITPKQITTDKESGFSEQELMSDTAIRPWVSLRQITAQYIDRNPLAVELLQQLKMYLDRFQQHGLSEFMQEWQALDCLQGKAITLNNLGKKIDGTVKGINQLGHLQLQMPDQSIKAFAAGDVTTQV